MIVSTNKDIFFHSSPSLFFFCFVNILCFLLFKWHRAKEDKLIHSQSSLLLFFSTTFCVFLLVQRTRKEIGKTASYLLLFSTRRIMGNACAKFLLIILSIFIPPIAVWIARNKICSGTVCINILLTILGWVNSFV